MDPTSLSLLVSLVMMLFRWALDELKKPEAERKTAAAVAALVVGAAFFAWMIFFRTKDVLYGTGFYLLGRRLFSRSGR